MCMPWTNVYFCFELAEYALKSHASAVHNKIVERSTRIVATGVHKHLSDCRQRAVQLYSDTCRANETMINE